MSGCERPADLGQAPTGVYQLCAPLNVLLWHDRDARGRPQRAISSDHGWHALTSHELWQMARAMTKHALHHDLDLHGDVRFAGDQLALTCQAALMGRPLLEVLPALIQAAASMEYDKAALATNLLQDLHDPTSSRRFGLADVAAALRLSAAETLAYLDAQRDALDDLHRRVDPDLD
jgi:hypothetical protein